MEYLFFLIHLLVGVLGYILLGPLCGFMYHITRERMGANMAFMIGWLLGESIISSFEVVAFDFFLVMSIFYICD